MFCAFSWWSNWSSEGTRSCVFKTNHSLRCRHAVQHTRNQIQTLSIILSSFIDHGSRRLKGDRPASSRPALSLSLLLAIWKNKQKKTPIPYTTVKITSGDDWKDIYAIDTFNLKCYFVEGHKKRKEKACFSRFAFACGESALFVSTGSTKRMVNTWLYYNWR